MDPFMASIFDQIAHCEDAIECLKSRLRFYRARLKKLNALMDSTKDMIINHVQETNDEHHD